MWLFFAITAALLWGLNYSLAEKILKFISPITLLFLEMLIGGLLFIPVIYYTTFKQDIALVLTQSTLRWLVIAEIIIVMLASFCIVASIKYKNATYAGIIELIYPLFIIFFTWIFFGENHVSLSVIIGGVCIFIGVLLMSLA